MKSVIRFGLLVMLAVGALTPAFGAQAQAPKPCFGLADADCQLLYGASAQDNMGKLTSFVVDLALTGKATGAPSGDVDFNISGNGPIALDQTALAALKSSTGATMMTGLASALKGITLQDMFKIAVNAPKTPTNLSGEIRLVGGQFYYMSQEKTAGKWMVMDLNTAMQKNPSLGMLGAMGASSSPSAGAMKDPKLQADGQALIKYIKASTSDGPSLDGAATKQFTFDVDLSGLVNGPEMKQFMTDATAAAAASGSSSSSSMGMAQMYMPMLAKLVSNSQLQLKYLVGSDDKLFHGLELVFAIKLDAATMNALQAMSSSGSSSSTKTPMTSDINANFDLKFTLSKIGQPVKVDPVPDAQKVGTGTTS
ncbi:MAG TPA: hypothetical protein VKQ72_10370 [Aggregatilineales bacterium]|nr:hypothetical protein [Aggregatilineales bacterium]